MQMAVPEYTATRDSTLRYHDNLIKKETDGMRMSGLWKLLLKLLVAQSLGQLSPILNS